MQHAATHCSTLQHNARQCTTLQYTATHCNYVIAVSFIAIVYHHLSSELTFENLSIYTYEYMYLFICMYNIHAHVHIYVVICILLDEPLHTIYRTHSIDRLSRRVPLNSLYVVLSTLLDISIYIYIYIYVHI